MLKLRVREREWNIYGISTSDDIKLQNMFQTLVPVSLAILILLLIKCGVCMCACACACACVCRVRSLLPCLLALEKMDWNIQVWPLLFICLFVSENTCCPLIQSLLSRFNDSNKMCTEPCCVGTGEGWKLDAQNTPRTGRSVTQGSACPSGRFRGPSCRIITEVPLVDQRRPL